MRLFFCIGSRCAPEEDWQFSNSSEGLLHGIVAALHPLIGRDAFLGGGSPSEDMVVEPGECPIINVRGSECRDRAKLVACGREVMSGQIQHGLELDVRIILRVK